MSLTSSPERVSPLYVEVPLPPHTRKVLECVQKFGLKDSNCSTFKCWSTSKLCIDASQAHMEPAGEYLSSELSYTVTTSLPKFLCFKTPFPPL